MSSIYNYDIGPKFPASDFLKLVLSKEDKMEYLIKEKKKIIDGITDEYYFINETLEEFEKINKTIKPKNHILSFIENDIRYYLKLKQFDSSVLYINTTQGLRDFFNSFRKDQGFETKILNIIDMLFRKIRTLDFDKDKSGIKLLYSTIIKNDYTNIILMLRTEHFIILPHNLNIFTPNDLFLLKKPKLVNQKLPNYTLFALTCFYNDKIDGIEITSIRHLGKIIKEHPNPEKYMNDWIIRLENLRTTIHAYYKYNFNIDDTDKIFIYVKYPEYKIQTLKFYTIYDGDFMSCKNMEYFLSRFIYLDDILDYIKLSKNSGKNILYEKNYIYSTNRIIKNNKNVSSTNTIVPLIPDISISDKSPDTSYGTMDLLNTINPLIIKQQYPIDIENIQTSTDIIISSNPTCIPLKINICRDLTNISYYKNKLSEYDWYFIEIRMNFIIGYGKDDVIFYGKYKGKYYSLEIKFKKHIIISDIVNLFANYYIGYFEFELVLNRCSDEKKIIEYTKTRYDTKFKQLLNNLYYDRVVVSSLLYDGEIPEFFDKQVRDGIELVQKTHSKFPQFKNNYSLKLLKLYLILNTENENNENDIECIYDSDPKKLNTCKMGNISDTSKKYISRMIFILDYTSPDYRFNMITTNTMSSVINNIDYYEYFKILFKNVFETKNIIEFVGWFLYNDSFTFKKNINDLKDENCAYIINMHRYIKIAFYKYFNEKLKINIPKNNIVLYYHRRSSYYGLHVRILIIKDFNKYLINRETNFVTTNKEYYSDEVENLLNLKINIFQDWEFCLYNVGNKQYVSKMSEIQDIPFIKPIQPIMSNTIIAKEIESDITPINMNCALIGGNKNFKNNFKSWTTIYLNIKNICKLYDFKKIIIDFTIEKKIKKIYNTEKYNKLTKYKYIMINSLGSKLRKTHIDIFNIDNVNDLLSMVFLILKKKTNSVLFIGKNPSTNDYFTISDNNKFNDFDQKYINNKYDIIIINHDIQKYITGYVVCQYYNKIIVSLIWSIEHISDNHIIVITFRDMVAPINRDLLLLLSQFSDITIRINYTIADPTGHPIKVIITNIKNKNILIEYLKEISTFECNLDLSFIKVNKVIKGSIEEFDNSINNICDFLFKRMFSYMQTYEIDKYKTNYPNISKENEELYLIKSLILFLIQDLYIENVKEDDYYIVFELMKKTKTKRILQVGMDNGIWSVFILTFFKFLYFKSDELYKLISVDPNQIIEYKNIGIDNLKNFNLLKYHKLVDDYSIIYMKKLIDKNKTYDIIFINEWITYDYTLEDLFNSLKLLNIGGYLIIDGILKKNNLKIIEYIDNVYKSLIKINMNSKNIAIYSKTE